MGDRMSCLINISWSTPINKLIIANTLESYKIFGHISLEDLHKFANAFSEQILTARGTAVFDAVLAKSVFISSAAAKMSGFTFRQLTECSKHVLEAIANRAMDLSYALREQLFTQLDTIVSALSSNAKSVTVAETYHNILKETIETAKSYKSKTVQVVQSVSYESKTVQVVQSVSYKSKTVQVVQSISGSMAEEVVESTAKYSARAAQCAKASLKAGVVFDGACLAYSAGKSYMKYRNGGITWEEHRETLMKRTGGAAGSVGMGAIGTFVGTLVFPGLGSFVGGVIGGLAGDYMGSWAGNEVDKTLF